jgi:tetratricopeptide (TPR) repeat protein
MRTGRVGLALEVAHRAEALGSAALEPDAPAMAEWMLGIAQHFAGDHTSARRNLEHVLPGPRPSVYDRWIGRAGFDPHCTARCVLAHLLWVQGDADQAAETVRAAVHDARQTGHPVTLCSVLAWGACSLALLAGDLDAARQSAAELLRHAERHVLGDHLAYGNAMLEVVALRTAGPDASAEQARATLERWHASQWHIVLGAAVFAEAAAAAELADEVTNLIDAELARAVSDQALWAYPEMLRVKGELLLLQEVPDLRAARDCFEQALAQANAQGALAWELRAAVSLHRLTLARGEVGASPGVLSRTIRRFAKCCETADLQIARQVLAGHGQRSIR